MPFDRVRLYPVKTELKSKAHHTQGSVPVFVTLALGGCSLLFSPAENSSSLVDAGTIDGAGDADVEPQSCERVSLLRDAFETGGPGRFELITQANGSAEEANGRLQIRLNGGGDAARYQSLDAFQIDNTEVVAEMLTNPNTGTEVVVGFSGQNANQEPFTLEAGRFGADSFGWRLNDSEDTQLGTLQNGADGFWRLRRSGEQFFIEYYDERILSFREDDQRALVDADAPVQAYVEGRRLGAGPDMASFGSVEVSTSPPDGWCGFENFSWRAEDGAALAVDYTVGLSGEGEFIQAANSVTLRVPTMGSQARLISRNRYDLGTAAVVISIEPLATTNSGTAVISFHHSSQDRFGFWIFATPGGLQLRGFAVIAGELFFIYSPYDPDQHKFLRISEPSSGLLLFETSANNETWQPLPGMDPPSTNGILSAEFPKKGLEVHIRADGANETPVPPLEFGINSIVGQAQ